MSSGTQSLIEYNKATHSLIFISPRKKVRELNAEYGVFFASVQGGEQAEWGTNTWAKLVINRYLQKCFCLWTWRVKNQQVM